MSHPFEGQFSPRWSMKEAIERITHGHPQCLCGNQNLLVHEQQPTHPMEDAQPPKDGHFGTKAWHSTCDIYECPRCGRKWEYAFSITHSTCLLKPGTCDS